MGPEQNEQEIQQAELRRALRDQADLITRHRMKITADPRFQIDPSYAQSFRKEISTYYPVTSGHSVGSVTTTYSTDRLGQLCEYTESFCPNPESDLETITQTVLTKEEQGEVPKSVILRRKKDGHFSITYAPHPFMFVTVSPDRLNDFGKFKNVAQELLQEIIDSHTIISS